MVTGNRAKRSSKPPSSLDQSMPSVTRATIYFVAALIATLPDTSVFFSMNITRNLHKVDRYTRTLVLCCKGRSHNVCPTSRTNTVFHSSKTVFAARPFRQGKCPGRRAVRCLGYLCAIHGIIEPLSGERSSIRHAVQVLDAKSVCGIDR